MSLNLSKSNWQRFRFGEVVDSITDRVDNPSEAGVDRYVGLEHLDPGTLTVQRWDSPDKVEAQKLRFRPGDVIFGRRRAYQKKVAMAEFEGICSAHALVLRAKPEHLDPRFLPIFLSSDYFLGRAISISVGSLSPTVNWRDLKVQEFDLPPLDEQKRIADLLWAVERDRQSSSELAHATWSNFRVLLRKVTTPTDAEAVRLDKVVDILDSKRVPLSAKERSTRKGLVPYYGAGGQIDSVDGFLFDEELVLLCEDGFGLAAWNERPIAYRIEGPAWVNNHAHVLRARDVSVDWLLLSLMHYNLSPYLSTTVKPKLNLSTVRSLPIRKPCNEAFLVAQLKQVQDAVSIASDRASAASCLLRTLRDEIFESS